MMKRSFRSKKIFDRGEAIGRILARPFEAFVSMQASGGIVLLLATIVALVWINSSLGPWYEHFKDSHLEIWTAWFSVHKPVHFWINEILMTFFFLMVGLEIKREVIVGELASFRQSALPAAAAVGGMVVPAVIYYALNHGSQTAKGWGIPMATDIAFTVGVLTILGSRVPHGLKVLLTALAIVDDIGAVLVIALWYTNQLSLSHLCYAGILWAVLAALNLMGFRRRLVYLLVGGFLWLMVYLSGIHSTIAGVLVALTIPARPRYDLHTFGTEAQHILEQFKFAVNSERGAKLAEESEASVRTLEKLCRGVQTPLQRILDSLHPWVAFLVVPLFAFANAGVMLEWANIGATLKTPLSLGIILGLFAGKQIGIVGAAWIAVKTGLAVAPAGVSWGHIYGGSILCGIGFTMSLFMADLAFTQPEVLETAKLSILLASLISFLIGFGTLYVLSTGKNTVSVMFGRIGT